MAKKSPLQIVTDKYGSKEKLVEAAAAVLLPASGESKEELSSRLKHVANAKLLHLISVADRIAKLRGREAVASKIAKLKGQAKDADFVSKVGSYSLSKLLDVYGALSKRAKA